MKSAAPLAFVLAVAGPAAARGLPDGLKPHCQGLAATAVAADTDLAAADALAEGRALLIGNNPAQALSAFQVALAQAPQSVAALNGIGIAYDRLGRSDLARQHFEMALALEPDAADIAHNLGLALERAGALRAAIPHLQRAAAAGDARVAAAARRTLARIADRLAAEAITPAAPAAPIMAAPGPRIDIASSGEAVLVLPPGIPARSAAPVRMAAATAAPAVPAPAPALPVAPAVAARLGEAAALTIPISLPEPAPEPLPEQPAQAPATIRPESPVPPRRLAVHAPLPEAPPAPAAPPTVPLPADRHSLPVLAGLIISAQRQPLAPRVLAQWRRAEPAAEPSQAVDMIVRAAAPPRPLPLPAQDDGKAAIRLAIARLELLIAHIEVHRG